MHATDSAASTAATRPDQRLLRKYRFDDADMDLFFMSALSWGPTGGLDIGQAFQVASTITDGDADSWIDSFRRQGELQDAQADAWQQRGWLQASGEARLKAFAAYRSAWQFATGGSDTFRALYRSQRAAFATAVDALALPVDFFQAPFEGKSLPGMFLPGKHVNAPVVLVIGGADTCYEDLFLSLGRSLWDRGYAVAIADLPGQGITADDGLYWSTEPERPIAAVVDHLIARFGAKPGRIALLGMSLGGYFVTRAAASDRRFATVIATTPFPRPGELFEASVQSAMANASTGAPTSAQQRARGNMLWKSGTPTPREFVAKWHGAAADPERVTVPFLSILGAGDSPIFSAQARDWHARIRSPRKDLVFLDADTGADGHCQVNARIRLVQEACGWMDDLFARTDAA